LMAGFFDYVSSNSKGEQFYLITQNHGMQFALYFDKQQRVIIEKIKDISQEIINILSFVTEKVKPGEPGGTKLPVQNNWNEELSKWRV